MNSEEGMKASEFIEYLEKAKSDSTARIYKRGLELFSEHYGKSLDEILEETSVLDDQYIFIKFFIQTSIITFSLFFHNLKMLVKITDG